MVSHKGNANSKSDFTQVSDHARLVDSMNTRDQKRPSKTMLALVPGLELFKSSQWPPIVAQ
eukprot:3296321-Amphidinium_carterae.1